MKDVTFKRKTAMFGSYSEAKASGLSAGQAAAVRGMGRLKDKQIAELARAWNVPDSWIREASNG